MNWMYYLLEANLYLVAFYALYLIFFRSQTHYQLNRAYLLVTSALAFIIPLLRLGFLVKPVEYAPMQISIGAFDSGIVPDAPPPSTPWTMEDYILLIYGLVAFVLLISLFIRIYLLLSLSKKGAKSRAIGFNIIELQGSAAFSFFNNLFIDDRLISSRTILHHEQVHIRQKHSWDIMYFELLKIINWFNPVIYLVIASIKEVHEFIADEETVRLESNNDDYTDFLLSNAYGITQSTLTNSFFNKNLLKRRITMLYQKKSGKAARLKYLLTLPLICGLLCLSTLAFTTKSYGWVIAPNKAATTPNTASKAQNTATEEYTRGWKAAEAEYKKTSSGKGNPSFPGGVNALYKFLKENIDHSVTRADGDIEDHLALTFVVEKEGNLSQIDINRIPNGQFSSATITEVKRVLASAPKWTPAVRNGEAISQKSFIIFDFTKDKSEPLFRADTDKIFNAVEKLPQFPGGYTELNNFLAKNIRYPKIDHDNGVQGRVFIQFIVEKDGSVSNARVLRSPSATLSEEALRVINTSPKWIPGMQEGNAVRARFTLPVNFSLADELPPPPAKAGQKLAPPHIDPDGKAVLPTPPPAAKPGEKLAPPPAKQDVKAYYALPVPQEVESSPKPYTMVDSNPEFPGGETGFAKFLQQTIRYPLAAKENKVQGKVYVQFTVEKDGSLSDIKILREPGSGLGDESVRVMKLSPKWIPAKRDGQEVRVQFTLPITFTLG